VFPCLYSRLRRSSHWKRSALPRVVSRITSTPGDTRHLTCRGCDTVLQARHATTSRCSRHLRSSSTHHRTSDGRFERLHSAWHIHRARSLLNRHADTERIRIESGLPGEMRLPRLGSSRVDESSRKATALGPARVHFRKGPRLERVPKTSDQSSKVALHAWSPEAAAFAWSLRARCENMSVPPHHEGMRRACLEPALMMKRTI